MGLSHEKPFFFLSRCKILVQICFVDSYPVEGSHATSPEDDCNGRGITVDSKT